MATLAPDSDSDSNYGYDLTAEEEEAVANLVACASSQAAARPVLAPSTLSPGSSATTSPLRADRNAAFAARTIINAPSHGGLDLAGASHDHNFTNDDDEPGVLPAVAKGAKRLAPSSVSWDASLAAFVDMAKPRSIPGPVKADGISYPDLSGALANVLYRAAADSKAEPEQKPSPGHETRSPLERFRSFPRKPFSVSDLTAGAWCELQYYYILTKLPGGKRTRTAAMEGGTKLHKKLEEEVYTTVKIDIAKKEDAFGLKLWNTIQGLRTLRDTGMTRELEIWGVVDGYVVNGMIDGLTYENPDPAFEEEIRSSQGIQNSQPPEDQLQQHKITNFFGSGEEEKSPQVYLFDVKTRGSKILPKGAAVRPTKIQLFLYHRFLSNMASGKLDFPFVFARYGLNLDERFSDTFVAQIGTLHDEIFDDAKSGSEYASAPSTPPPDSAAAHGQTWSSSPPPDLIHYKTLRELLPLLQSELHLTFPRGADSLGTLVTVEYRRRARPPPPPQEVDADGMTTGNGAAGQGQGQGQGEGESEDAGGEVIGENVFYVDDGVLDAYLAGDMEWWGGRREPRGVVIEEAYKCRSCEFAEDCDWRKSQEAELLRAARARRGKRKA